MPGTRTGGLKASNTIYSRYGKNFFVEIGRRGGEVKGEKGFALDLNRASTAGKKGGRVSRRGLRIIERLPDNQIKYQVKATGEEIVLAPNDKFRSKEYSMRKEP